MKWKLITAIDCSALGLSRAPVGSAPKPTVRRQRIRYIIQCLSSNKTAIKAFNKIDIQIEKCLKRLNGNNYRMKSISEVNSQCGLRVWRKC